ncbi:Endoplasmic reticulum-Golgi intermediate compartment protein 3 [Camellia lanceoleosa]|uniref:Endoplasmic reticulum-Golgi intermediate compartment protein 3 n=1 Tax=Camellia lanceoleosa TaxID=1840588 RepID=A0ACC0HB73_9ERIC|nr:Endoplasmic reticulum-Golgi intermediate compartment protein 3 [Camellia lanceoleosa]
MLFFIDLSNQIDLCCSYLSSSFVLQRVHNGEAKCTKRSNCQGTSEKTISEDEMVCIKGCDSSNVEGAPVADGVPSLSSNRPVAPVRKDVYSTKINQKPFDYQGFAPMVDETMNWQKVVEHERFALAKGPIHVNVSHIIHDLSFGPKYPGIHNPLDETSRILRGSSGTFKYYIKIVPTEYGYLSKEVLPTNQFSVTEYYSPMNEYDRTWPVCSHFDHSAYQFDNK